MTHLTEKNVGIQIKLLHKIKYKIQCWTDLMRKALMSTEEVIVSKLIIKDQQIIQGHQSILN